MKFKYLYWWSEDHIRVRRKAEPKLERLFIGGYMDYGCGICTKNGWLIIGLEEL